jgi:hypothetical protein
MKKSILALALLGACAVPASAQSIGGQYTTQGTNLDGSPYSGTADITLTSETTCEIKWATGSTEASGICMRNDDAFSAAYVLNGEIGLVIYKAGADGTLSGLWTVAGKEGSGTEVLTPIK